MTRLRWEIAHIRKRKSGQRLPGGRTLPPGINPRKRYSDRGVTLE